MTRLIELIDRIRDITPAGAALLICLAAMGLVWKALDVIADKKSGGKKP